MFRGNYKRTFCTEEDLAYNEAIERASSALSVVQTRNSHADNPMENLAPLLTWSGTQLQLLNT